MGKEIKKYDMKKKPLKCWKVLLPITYFMCKSSLKKHNEKLELQNMDGLKSPFVVLANHNAFLDFSSINMALFPKMPYYVVAIDGFIGREWLMRRVGCICKRKFTNDITLIKHLKYLISKGEIVIIYPEARYSLCGTTSVLPESLGKLCKLLNVPIVTCISHGHHINHPFWNTRHERGVQNTHSVIKQLLTQEKLKSMSVDEINKSIVDEFQYDDFKWQKENNIKINDIDRAVGLEKVLYQCPCCKTEYKMMSSSTKLICKECGAEWEMTELGELKCLNKEETFTHIPDWYEWERLNVRKEVEEGTYSTGVLPVSVESLPNSKGYIKLGEGTLVHDMNGFNVSISKVEGHPSEMILPVEALYSCHIEYEYLFKHGDCVDLNTLTDTWYIYPHDCEFAVTKIAIATEELYLNYKKKTNKPIHDGLL